MLGLSLNGSSGTISGTISANAFPGIYKIQVTATAGGGSDTAEYFATVLPSSSVTFGVHVMTSTGTDLSGASVSIVDCDNVTVYTGTTDANGLCTSISIDPTCNPHTVTITKSGMTTDVLPIPILDDMTFQWRLMTSSIDMDATYLATLPKSLPTTDRKYILQQDISAPLGALTCGTNGINIDLNGHTITFLNGDYGVPNAGFESGTGASPSDWDLGTSGAQRTTTLNRPMTGSWYLAWPRNDADKTILSDWADLPLSQNCKASWTTPVSQGVSDIYLTIEIEHSVSGIIASKITNAHEGHLTFASGATAGQFRIRVTRLGYPAPAAWQASHTYAVGDRVAPTVPDGYVRRVNSAGGVSTGTTGGSEPAWPTTLGATITDGNIVWRCSSINGISETSTVWSTGLSRSLDSKCRPTSGTTYTFEVVGLTNTGTSSGTQPTWLESTTTTDNNLVWSVGLFYDQWEDEISSGPEDYAIDDIQMTPLNVYGVSSQFVQRTAVYNGTITQQSPGDRCGGLYLRGQGLAGSQLYAVNVTVEMQGTNSFGIAATNGTAGQVIGCTVSTTARNMYDRTQLYGLIDMGESESSIAIGNRVSTRSLLGIKIDDDKSTAKWNHVHTFGAQTNHPGILVRGGLGTATKACHASYNTVFAEFGQCLAIDRMATASYGNTATWNRLVMYGMSPNVEYGWFSMDAVRSNDYGGGTLTANSFEIANNYITLHCKYDPSYAAPPDATKSYMGAITALMEGTSNTIHDNTIEIIAIDDEVSAYAFVVENDTNANLVDVYGNNITTDWFVFAQGGYAGKSNNVRYRQNTISQGSNPAAAYSLIVIHPESGGNQIQNMEFRDTTIDVGDVRTLSLAPGYASLTSGQPYDWDVTGTLTLTVTNGVTVIQSATVTITDGQGGTAYNGATDENGQVVVVLKKEHVRWNAGGYTYTDYSDHLITVSKAGYTTQTNVPHEQGQTAASKTITLVAV